ncbi:PREDICTED: uncharacterized protein C12orf40 homolog [Pterocles gutturalis]|uniref:uncharacterized protein C12orf40 homolog n=1 Tax=Pterocles gutturalis TaxID=240206 RepID=UPI0005280E46|nr:PREDICTED: uncharacterized protein C12orf40 homolog [Pterocles gutturalis]
MKLLEVSDPKSSAVSLDLLNLYVVNQLSTKKENTENVKKPVHININKVKIPVRRHNIELPTSPLRTQHISNLDDIQNRLQKQVLDSRRQHLSEKAKYQHNPGNSSDQDPWITKRPSQCIFGKSDRVSQELFKPLHRYRPLPHPRLDYMNSAGKNQNESENSEGIKVPLFDVVKETAELKAPQEVGSDFSFLSLFEDESKSIPNNPSTEHFNPFVNQSSAAIFFMDPDDRNQMTNINYLYDTREAYPAMNAKNHSVDRHLEGIFTGPEWVLPESNNASSAGYKTTGLHKTHLQDCHEGEHYFRPSENNEKPANLEKIETFAYHHDQWISLKENVQNCSRKKSDDESVKESAWRQNQLFGFEEFTTAQEEDYKFGESSNLCKMEKDVESSLNSQSPSYSPRQTESCFSSSLDASEEEDIDKKKEYLNEQSLKIDDANLVSASSSTECPKTSHTRTVPLQPSSILTRDEGYHLQEKDSILCATEKENKNHTAPFEGSSLDQAPKREPVTCSARCDGWSQTEISVPEVRKVDVATQCGTMQVCSCGGSLAAARSPGGLPPPSTPSTIGGHKMLVHEGLQPAGMGSTAGIAKFSSEAECLSLSGRTLEVLNYIDIMKV